MKKKSKQKFKPLSSATPEERYRAMELATYWVTDEVEGHTDSGAFSEAYLGEPARLYFPRNAYEKLKDPNSKWKWKEGTQLSTLMINDMNNFGLIFETLAVRDLRVYEEALDVKLTLLTFVVTRDSRSELISSSSSSLSKAKACLALHSLERRFRSPLATPKVVSLSG